MKRRTALLLGSIHSRRDFKTLRLDLCKLVQREQFHDEIEKASAR